MSTPLEAAVAELLRAWDLYVFPGGTWPWLHNAIDALRRAHANHVDGGEYQRGRRDGAAEERTAIAAWLYPRDGRIAHAIEDGAHRAAPAPSREGPR